jgi:hypothetical protein
MGASAEAIAEEEPDIQRRAQLAPVEGIAA